MKWLIALEHSRQDFLSSLDQTLGPAGLLRFERRHFHWKLGRALHILTIDKLPSLKLGAVGKIGILGERIVLPSASLFDCFASPHARSSIEIEEHVAARAPGMFQNEVAVEQDGLNFGEE